MMSQKLKWFVKLHKKCMKVKNITLSMIVFGGTVCATLIKIKDIEIIIRNMNFIKESF